MAVRRPEPDTGLAPGQTRLSLLGGWALTAAAGPVPLPVRRLLAWLALRGPAAREELCAALWPETSPARARGSLRTALWRVRSLHEDLVDAEADVVELRPEVAVDVHELAQDVRRLAAGNLPLRLRNLPEHLLDGDLLPGWYDEWLTVERERVRQLRLHALEGVAAALAAEGCFSLALEAALAAVREEPLRESAHRVVLRVHLQEGNRSEALRHYESYRRLLRSDLGVAPSAQLLAVLQGGPAELPRQRVPEGAPGSSLSW
jgi:DNA-binding SARP family transcriptional activator